MVFIDFTLILDFHSTVVLSCMFVDFPEMLSFLFLFEASLFLFQFLLSVSVVSDRHCVHLDKSCSPTARINRGGLYVYTYIHTTYGGTLDQPGVPLELPGSTGAGGLTPQLVRSLCA